MSDIVERLRKWCHAVNAASAQDLMDEAADEIERLHKIVAGYTDGISAVAEVKQSYEKSDEKRMNANMSYTINKKAYEGDIVSRLRNWRGLHLAHSGGLFESAADEIERLRNGAVNVRENDHIADAGKMVPTLTDAEREAIEWYGGFVDGIHADALRKLLERMK